MNHSDLRRRDEVMAALWRLNDAATAMEGLVAAGCDPARVQRARAAVAAAKQVLFDEVATIPILERDHRGGPGR